MPVATQQYGTRAKEVPSIAGTVVCRNYTRSVSDSSSHSAFESSVITEDAENAGNTAGCRDRSTHATSQRCKSRSRIRKKLRVSPTQAVVSE